MTEKTFDDDFVRRLMELTGEIERAGMPPDDDYPPDGYEAEEEAETASLRSDFERSFAAIVQCFSDQHNAGAIEALEDAALRRFVKMAIEASDQWDEHEHDCGPGADAVPATPLQSLLKKHYDIGEHILDLENGPSAE